MKFCYLTVLMAIISWGCVNNNDPVEPSSGNDKTDDISCGFTNFKYYNNEPDTLGEMSGDYIFIGSDSLNSEMSIRNLVKSKEYFDHSYDFEINQISYYAYKYSALKLRETFDCEKIAWIINDLKKHSVIDYAHYTIQTDDCRSPIGTIMGEQCVLTYSSSFSVKVKDTNDLSDLMNMKLETNTRLVGKSSMSKDWYHLQADKNSKGDALEMANFFHETGYFIYAEPDIFLFAVK